MRCDLRVRLVEQLQGADYRSVRRGRVDPRAREGDSHLFVSRLFHVVFD